MLLWFAVCESDKKMNHIQLIFQMDDELAAELQAVVQEQQAQVHVQHDSSSTSPHISRSPTPLSPFMSPRVRLVEPNTIHSDMEARVRSLELEVTAAHER